jgi:dephospho-CoA kinase
LNEQVAIAGKIVIGLTGNIATGKSAVMRLAYEQGALTIDADKIVHELLNSDTVVQNAIVEQFGASIQLGDGRINRPALGKIVFNDAQALDTFRD